MSNNVYNKFEYLCELYLVSIHTGICHLFIIKNKESRTVGAFMFWVFTKGIQILLKVKLSRVMSNWGNKFFTCTLLTISALL